MKDNKSDPQSGGDSPRKIPEETEEQLRKTFENFPPEVQRQLRDLMEKAETLEDFAAFALTGPCPRCGNELTRDGESAAAEDEEGDPTVGECSECGFHWCLDCGRELSSWPCPHWEAWEEYCRKHQIYQGEDGHLEEGYAQDYIEWLRRNYPDTTGM